MYLILYIYLLCAEDLSHRIYMCINVFTMGANKACRAMTKQWV